MLSHRSLLHPHVIQFREVTRRACARHRVLLCAHGERATGSDCVPKASRQTAVLGTAVPMTRERDESARTVAHARDATFYACASSSCQIVRRSGKGQAAAALLGSGLATLSPTPSPDEQH